LREKRIRRVSVRAEDAITGFAGAAITVLNPAEDVVRGDNDDSVVFKMSWEGHGVLFCGDITARAMERISGYGELLRNEIIKVPHHASGLGKAEAVKDFFAAVSPKYAVMTSGHDTVGRTRCSDVIKTLENMKVRCYDTGSDGAVIVTLGKNRLSIKDQHDKNN
jgi:beta-lactamase superfamily II metal-dependent hydrolase